MMRTIKIFCLLLAFATLLWRCKQKYISPYVSPPTGYLVVEGYIAGNGPTQFSLSRTLALPGDSAVPAEINAKLQVEGDDNSVYPLNDQGNGIYGINALPLHIASKYRLRIRTADGEEYLSDLVPFKPTPPIDSINWTNDATGIAIYANTHDPANATRYYQWKYVETWEYNSAEGSFFEYRTDTVPPSVVPRTPERETDRCWHTTASSVIFLASSEKLAQDLISLYPLTHLPANSQVTSVLYSLSVSQYALTKDAYDFLALVQKNSGSLGSLFDVQPSELNGNIHCLSHPGQQVVGFISAGTVQQQRIFISRSRITSNYAVYCPAPDIVVALAADSLKKYFGHDPTDPNRINYTPILKHFTNGRHDGWISNASTCVDCTLQGGSNQKPSFWPN
jgi:hypothetical protein